MGILVRVSRVKVKEESGGLEHSGQWSTKSKEANLLLLERTTLRQKPSEVVRMQVARQGCKHKTEGVLILPTSWGGNWAFLEIKAKGEVEELILGREEAIFSESSGTAPQP